MVMLKTFLRDPMVEPYSFHCQSISCNQFAVNSADGKPLVQIANSGSQSGQIRLFGSQQHLTMLLHADRGGQRGQMEIMDDGGPAGTVIGTEEGGGYVRLNSRPLVSSIFLGHDGQQQVSGLLATKDGGAFIAVYEDGTLRPWGSLFSWKALNGTSDATDEPAPPTDGQRSEEPGTEDADNKDSTSSADGRDSSNGEPNDDAPHSRTEVEESGAEEPRSSEEPTREAP
jgi:hypothetical protein